MQVKKNQIRSKLLRVARTEFAQNGFSGTTMRAIARKSGIATSNIYNYFNHKEELFEEIVKPTLSRILDSLSRMDDMDRFNGPDLFDYSLLKKQFEGVIYFIDHHRDDLKLILFKSVGSEVHKLKENFIDRYTEILNRQLLHHRNSRSKSGTEISRFFVHNLCSMYMNIIMEIIMHGVSLEKMKLYSKEFLTFVYHGLDALSGIGDE